MTGGPVTLYVRAGCPLCDTARRHLESLGLEFEEIDVDAEPALAREFGERLPVVAHRGLVIAEGEVDPERLRRVSGA